MSRSNRSRGALQGGAVSAKKDEGKVTLGSDVRKADTKALITNGTDAFPEDSFVGSYWTGGDTSGIAILEPQFKPGTLYALVSQNNTLAQCIEAMEVNIDGTGHSIELVDGEAEDDKEKQILEDFFKEPYPGKSMIELRRATRRDQEAAGNGYLEVIRNAGDEVVMLNQVDCIDMRLIRLDDPVEVTRTLTRAGKEISVKVRTRERRFVQLVNGKKVYFKEFGASRDLDRSTGQWSPQGTRLPIEQRASEILHLCGNKEPKTPYGTPRWLNQLPSVLGSRKAEEHNLEFFDAGGLPPVLVIVQGGTLGTEVKDDLRSHLSGKGSKHRAAIVEAISTSGSIDSAGSVQVRVERFGAERQQDSMFQNYDKACEEHIRCSFRLPPLFIGKASDFNFATAYTAYMVAEAQVFYPERDEFDAVINTKIVRSLGVKKYKFRSLPMTLVDVTNQLKGIEIVSSAKIAEPESIVKALNEMTGLALEFKEPPKEPTKEEILAAMEKGQQTQGNQNEPTGKEPAKNQPGDTGEGGTMTGNEVNPGQQGGRGVPVTPPAAKGEVVQLAAQWANVLGLDGEPRFSNSEQVLIRKQVSELEGDDLHLLNQVLATKSLNASSVDSHGLGELCGCASHLTEQ